MKETDIKIGKIVYYIASGRLWKCKIDNCNPLIQKLDGVFHVGLKNTTREAPPFYSAPLPKLMTKKQAESYVNKQIKASQKMLEVLAK